MVLRVRGSLTGFVGGPGVNTFYFRGIGVTQAYADAAIARVRDFYVALAPEMASGMIMQVEPVADELLTTDGSLTASWAATTPPASVASTGISQAPAPVMSLVQWSTGGIVAGRRVRGRTFVGPVETTAHQTDGTPAEAHRTAVVGAANALLGDIGLEQGLVIWARPFPGDPLATPPVPARSGTAHKVTAAAVPNKWAVLRSRRD